MTLAGHLQELSEKHRTLELRIQEELARPGADDLQINRLKKEKLRVKEELIQAAGERPAALNAVAPIRRGDGHPKGVPT